MIKLKKDINLFAVEGTLACWLFLSCHSHFNFAKRKQFCALNLHVLDGLFPYLTTKITHFDWIIKYFLNYRIKMCDLVSFIQSKCVILVVSKEKIHLIHANFNAQNLFRFVKLKWL